MSYDWTGSSYQEKRPSGTSRLALYSRPIMAFLILAAQYEKWSLPLSVLLAMPFGIFGSLAAVWLGGKCRTRSSADAPLTNDVYFQIGLVTLLGLAAKNAILIVEFAVYKSQEGMSAAGAALEAARLRFRPILMTSLAFILGVAPLAFSSGAGAGRASLGGYGRDGRHDGRNFPRDLLCAAVLQGHHRLENWGESRRRGEIRAEAAHAHATAPRRKVHSRAGTSFTAGGSTLGATTMKTLHEATYLIRQLALACVSLSGCCTVGPDYQRPAIELPSGFTDASPDKCAVASPSTTMVDAIQRSGA